MNELLICACNSLEHQIILHYDEHDKEVCCYIHLSEGTFWDRLKKGMAYIFGYKCKYGHWDEFIFRKEHIPHLEKMVELLKRK